MAAGAMDVFRKPFDADSFLTAVETAVRQSRSAHVSYDKLHHVAAPPMAATGYFEPNSVLTAEEADHFRHCEQCINALADMVRKVIQERERKKAARDQS